MVVGMFLRIHRYLLGRSLWIDEAMLSLNILERSVAELLQPLARGQAAPPGFLLLTKLSVFVLGPSEYGLRLIPLLAGIAALPLCILFLRPLAGIRATAITLAFLAFLEPLLYYSSEAKQYSSDALWCLLILAGGSWLRREPRRLRWWALLMVVGVLAPWFSHPSIFVLAATGVCLVFRDVMARSYGAACRLAALSACWLGSFSVEYLLVLRELDKSRYLHDYWQHAFPPVSAGFLGLTSWLLTTNTEFLGECLGIGNGALVAFVLLIGLAALWRKSQVFVSIVLCTAFFAIAAGVLQRYPLHGRLLLFFVPAVAIAMGAGIDAMWNCLAPRYSGAGMVLLGICLLVPMKNALDHLRNPTKNRVEELSEALSYVAGHARDGDVLYVYRGAVPAYEYYSTYGSFKGLTHYCTVCGASARGVEASYAKEIQNIGLHPRVWMIFTHEWFDPKLKISDSERLVTIARERGKIAKCFSLERAGGLSSTSVWLCDFSKTEGLRPQRDS